MDKTSYATNETSKLIQVIQTLQATSLDNLKSVEFVADQIRSAGLVFDHRNLYGADNRYMNARHMGLWQIPMQLAKCLVQLSRYDIKTGIEIGTWSGWTISFITAYLLRFNPTLKVTTVDIGNGFGFGTSSLVRLLPITFHMGTSNAFRDRAFDFAFIDADHAYASCRKDYDSVGSHARFCVFHDINDEDVASYAPNDGGVPRFWKELTCELKAKSQRYEFLDHSEGERVMGIGLLVRSEADLC